MNRERFEKLLDELDGNSLQTLKQKNAKYAPGDDTLHNFNAGGDVFGGTPAQACWGYLTKHLVALRDKVQNNDFHDRADLLEKCQDSINYIRFLWCLGNAEMDKYTQGVDKRYQVKVDGEVVGYTNTPGIIEQPTEAYLKQKADYDARIKAERM